MPALQTLVYGGAPMRPATLREVNAALPDVRLLNVFGQTEGSPLSVLTPADHRAALQDRPELLLSVGRAVPGLELALHAAGQDGVGEVLARADHLFHRDAEGWLHTGDLGRLDGEGYLYLSGRRHDMIVRGGENVHPVEVELAVAEHPGVADVAVVGVADARLGETVVAFVVPADHAAPPDAEQLHSFTRHRLSGFKVPARWHLVAELPRNANGKLLRRRLSEPR
jgi:acyl-CoA synthetase (AMP-forming)/AMP-acid ligase II